MKFCKEKCLGIKRIGIDVGGHKISAGEVDCRGDIPVLTAVKTVQTPQTRDLRSLLAVLEDLVLAASPGGAECFVGIGLPGFVSRDRAYVHRLTNFRGCDGVPFAFLISQRLKERGVSAGVRLENDANCAAVGECLCGAARGMENFAVLTLGSGIGSGLAANGRLITGAHGMAGECGHLAVCSEDEFRGCMCGGIGHLEEAASADWLEKRAREAGLPADFRTIWDMRAENDAARSITETSLSSLARGIASVSVMLDPEAVIISGGMSRACGIAEELRSRTMRYLPAPMRPVFRLLLSELGSSAAVMGAALLDMAE